MSKVRGARVRFTAVCAAVVFDRELSDPDAPE
ncbi:hypothetical protein M2283_002045 [Streptomyces pseudovenezuelae]|uniref:Uncharacterized protein n=1 Tax=Streptomyces pseudovenezuelae TaxID=67350 RepID=A0ABT6LEM7_9ACTN|nr:hypothetical protein [Streptomyces pseudovenezuelae]